MLESFTEVTELLRHFYAVLHRPGTVPDPPSTTTATTTTITAASKAQAILSRLIEVHAKSLEARKRQLSEVYKANIERKEAALGLVNNILLLIQRANVTWNIFCNQ